MGKKFMKTKTAMPGTSLTALVAAIALVCGCASGGGGSSGSSGSGSPNPDPALAPLRPGYEPSPCGSLYGYPVPCQSRFPDVSGMNDVPQATSLTCLYYDYCPPQSSVVKPIEVSFYSWWSASRPENKGNYFVFDRIRSTTSYELDTQGLIRYSGAADTWTDRWFAEMWDGTRFREWPTGGAFSTRKATVANLKSLGQPGLDVLTQSNADRELRPNPFVSTGVSDLVVIAKPFVEGWNYQSFGVWNDSIARTATALSYGYGTPASAVPTIGAATFTGKLAGLYVSPAGEGSIATANLKVVTDFSARSLSFASAGTTLTRDLATSAAAPSLNLGGTLTYSAGSSLFSGTLTNAGNTMSGQSTGRFYGRSAQELGGVFALKSSKTTETFVGAYGAKR